MKMGIREFLAILVVLIVLAIVLLPSLARSREAARRASCQNNLKQLGIVMKMYANESRGAYFPPRSPVPGNWTLDMNAVYPDYLSDLNVLKCPGSPLYFTQDFMLRRSLRHPGVPMNRPHLGCVSGKYYTYTGYLLTGDEPALALYLASHANGGGAMGDLKLPIPRWENSTWKPVGGIAVMWDRIPPDPALAPHENLINVLSMDGHVQPVCYSPLNQSENFPVTEMTALTFGLDMPRIDPDCF